MTLVDVSFVDPAVVTNDDTNALGVLVVTPMVTCLGNMPSLKSVDCVDLDAVKVEACEVSANACVTSDMPGPDLSVELRALDGVVGGVVGVGVDLVEYDVSDKSALE